jgi:hypothetical protein
MSRFVFVNLVVGFLAAAIGFGDFAGIPRPAILVGRVTAAICLLLVAAYWISQRPSPAEGKRARRDQRLKPRESRLPQ